MSGKIQRYPTSVAMPLTKTRNQLNFLINQEEGQIDMNSSYLELEVILVDSDGNVPENYNDVVLGRDNIMYNPTCIVRDAKLYGTRSGKKYQDLMYVNLLSQNLQYWTAGKNEIRANTLWSGMGAKSQDGTVYSVFNNTYKDANPVIRVPIKDLYPGSIGNSDMFPAGEDLSFTFLLEPYYRLFQSLTASNYEAPEQAASSVPAGVAFVSGGQAQSILTASAVGTIAGYLVNQYVTIDTNTYKITAVTPDSGNPIVPGSITIDGQVAVGNCTVLALYPTLAGLVTAGTTACNNVTTNADNFQVSTVTATTQAQAPAVGKTVEVNYFFYQPGGMATVDFISLKSTAYTKVLTSVAGVITFSPLTDKNGTVLTFTNNTVLYGITLDLLSGDNLDDYDWNLVNAHLVLYRRSVPFAPRQKMLVSNFESMNISVPSGLNKFMYTFLVNNNCYNAYGFLPTNDNMYSQAQNMGTYQYSVDNKPLTTLYLELDKSLHTDNMVRTLKNSPYYPVKNLNQDRDDEEAPNPTEIDPIMYPAKLHPSMEKGQPIVEEGNEKVNLKLEIIADDEQDTPGTTLFLFCEKYQEI